MPELIDSLSPVALYGDTPNCSTQEDFSGIDGISQEHGILEKCGKWMDGISLGDQLSFLPDHSCLTANLMRGYLST